MNNVLAMAASEGNQAGTTRIMSQCLSLTIRGVMTVAVSTLLCAAEPEISWNSNVIAQDRGQEPDAAGPIPFKTGNDYRKALTSPTSIAWQEVPLRQGLRNLSAAHSVAVFLDRRVDPGLRTNISAKDKTLGYVLYKIADHLDLGICFEANLVYIGPREVTARLPTLLAYHQQKIASFDAAAKTRLRKSNPVRWEMAAESRELIAATIEQFDFATADTEIVPHDIWYEGQLPEGRADQQLTVLLNGFDLMITLNNDGRSLKLIEIPTGVEPTIEYAVPAAEIGKVKEIEKEFEKAKFTASTRKLKLTGSFADHAKVYLIFNPPPSAETAEGASEGEKRYDLVIKAQAGSVLATIAKQLDREFKYDPSIRNLLAEQVTIEAKQATVEELLRQALEPLGLQYRLEEKTLTIVKEQR